ncbi:MAG: hypothetical protein FJ146_06515 [Deltaproteobacteria bacterium]|nr:hypothetical protein [Deltaproteobacteria bacterium]
MIRTWFRNPPDWAYRLMAISPALVFLTIALVAPDPAGFDGTYYRAARFVGPLDTDISSIDDIKNQPESAWEAKEAKHHFGVMGSVRPVWYRIQVRSQADPKPIIAEIGYHLIRKVDFYLVEAQAVVASAFGGLERPGQTESPFATIKFLPSTTQDRTLYLRLETDVAIVAPLFIGVEANHRALMTLRSWVHAAMAGIYLSFCMYNLLLLFTVRKLIYALLVASQIGNAFFPLFFSGQIFYIWPDFSRDISVHVLIIAEIILIPQLLLMFLNHSYVVRDLGRHHLSSWAKFVIAFTALEVVLAPIFRASPILIVMVTVTNVAVCTTAIVDIMRWPIRSLVYYRMFLSGFLPAVVISMGSWLGFIPASYFAHYFADAGVIFGFIFLSAAATHRIRQLELKHRGIVRSLRGESNKLTESLTESELNLAPISSREIDVTIMYIDIMAFSLVADRDASSDIFADLSRRLNSLTRLIVANHGVIDRSLGDGLLCFFTGKNESSAGHARDAFHAAVAIQNMLIDEALRIKKQGQYEKDWLLPVRIGIHSDTVLLANLGGGLRVDFTMVGHGVNFVSNLEQACSPFNVMISAMCFEKLVASGLESDVFSPVNVSLKHQKNLALAYEFSLEKTRPEDLRTAISVYFSQVGVFPREARHALVSTQVITLKAPHAKFQVLDFSASGMRVISEHYFAQKVIMELEIDTGVEILNQKLRQKYMDQLVVEVRWSRKTEAGYEHGIKLLGGNSKQVDLLIHVFSTHMKVVRDAPLRGNYGT